MRRGERAIESKDGQKAILEHCRVCSLAFSGDEYPYVIPLNYGFVWNEDQETPVLYFHGAPVGTKIEQYDPEGGPYEFAPEVAARTTVLCLRVETLTGKSNAPKPEQP